MKIYNQDKTIELQNPDFSKGYLKQDILEIKKEAVQEVKEEFHYEVIREYPNGGKDVKKVIDVKGVKAEPERIITEEIQVYIPYTEEEIEKNEAQQEIYRLKMQLDKTDYITSKLAEAIAIMQIKGDDTRLKEVYGQYEEVINQRQEWRDTVGDLEDKYFKGE
jgi:hypothetical protein